MPRIITFSIGDKVQLKHSVAIDASRRHLSHHPGWMQDLIYKSDISSLLGTIVSFQDKSTINKIRGKQYCPKILVRYETPVFAQSRYRMDPDGYTAYLTATTLTNITQPPTHT